MKKITTRRLLGIAAVVIGTQLLAGCVVLPAPAYRPRAAVVVDVGHPYYAPPPPPPPRGYYRGWR